MKNLLRLRFGSNREVEFHKIVSLRRKGEDENRGKDERLEGGAVKSPRWDSLALDRTSGSDAQMNLPSENN
jgi:hypothetical protein